nr:HAMP domain-containing sensor histidine kinase [Psychromicrobium silvestre]
MRSKLILVSLVLLALLGSGMGVASYFSMDSYLTAQLDDQLDRSAHAAAQFVNKNPPPSGTDTKSTTRPNPLDAPGQGEGILSAHVTGGVLDTADGGWVDVDPQRTQHSFASSDIPVLTAIQPGSGPKNYTLSMGEYRIEAVVASDGSTVITGLPLSAKNNTLSSLRNTLILVALLALLLSGVLGTLLIRRSLRPLEHVSEVANRVAGMPLDAGQVALVERVDPSDNETEVGRVGYALNRMLDNVEGALAARHQSELKVRQFVADASHELRTPLTSIQGYSELVVRTEKLSEQGRESLERVRSQAGRMSGLVDDLLLLARYDESRELALAEVDLTQLLIETVSDMRISDLSRPNSATGEANPQPHRWEIKVPEEPLLVRGDESQLHRVLMNLLSNARKHTDPGTEVVAGLQRSADGSAVITVTDNGAGIAPDFLPEIFSRFARADVARSGVDGTTGLGLPIVKAIVEAHGGKVRVTSVPGRTEFLVRLPELKSEK